jgi:hypothetical protein
VSDVELKHQPWRPRPLALLLLAVLILAGCKGKSTDTEPAAQLPATPEEAILQVHAACLAGEYQKVLHLFKNGPETWKSNPGYAKDLIDKVCLNAMGQQGKHIELRNPEIKGEGARIETFTYATPDKQDWGRYSEWQLIKTTRGWLIVSLRST